MSLDTLKNWLALNNWSTFSLNKAIVLLSSLLLAYWAVDLFVPVEHSLSRGMRVLIIALALISILALFLRSLFEFLRVAQKITSSVNHLIRAKLGIKLGGAPDPYIRALFDDYADQFEDHLVKSLGYKVPEQMRNILDVSLDQSKRYQTLDLGCGTGLCAKAFRGLTDQIFGVDLSAAMLAKAEQTGLYSNLVCGSLVDIDKRFNNEFDLVVAADVLIYFGQLDTVFIKVAGVMRPKGYFIFSLEFSESESWEIQANGRYAHSPDYVCKIAEQNGFTLLEAKTEIQRWEAEKPVLGEIYLFQAP